MEVYRAITHEEIAAHDATYMGTQDRRAQDNAALYACLMNSLSKAGKEKVALRRKDYAIGPEPSSPLLLKTTI